jgi:hypothetical protein
MGMLLIHCPKTGWAISTGRYASVAAFRCTPVFFSRTYCPLCHEFHEWFAKDAWVGDPNLPNMRCSRGAGPIAQSPTFPSRTAK